MTRGILYVESRPNSPEEAEAYHQWYNETHMKEIVSVEGFLSARRYQPVGQDGPFVAIYEFEGDDVESVRARLNEATRTVHSRPVGVQLDPPPTVVFYEEIASYTP